jgi:hypothetical protein|tara:strand:- start:452 stop:610 length:159 start_codon:yes stop_codon:yes gene_type:complete
MNGLNVAIYPVPVIQEAIKRLLNTHKTGEQHEKVNVIPNHPDVDIIKFAGDG